MNTDFTDGALKLLTEIKNEISTGFKHLMQRQSSQATYHADLLETLVIRTGDIEQQTALILRTINPTAADAFAADRRKRIDAALNYADFQEIVSSIDMPGTPFEEGTN